MEVAGWLALLLSPRHCQRAGPHGPAEDSPLSPARGMPRLCCPLTATGAPPLLLSSSSSPPLPPPSSPSLASPPPPAPTSRWLSPRPELGRPPSARGRRRGPSRLLWASGGHSHLQSPGLSCRHLRPGGTLFWGGALDFASSPPAPRSLHPGAVTAVQPREEDEDALGGGLGSR